LTGITPLAAETQAAAAAGQDLAGMIAIAAQHCADAIAACNAILDFIPSGSNKTTLSSQVSTLT
jgi:hypothetical protein